MRALVVVESVFGNTRRIADAVAGGLGGHLDVTECDVVDAPDTVEGFDLLVLGGPTHAFGMTRPNTRQAAAEQSGGAVEAATIGLREWLLAVHVGPIATAVFDTRTDKPRLPGSAAKGAARQLRKRGLRLLTPPETFRVLGTEGPLLDGEQERAAAWGETLATRLATAQHA